MILERVDIERIVRGAAFLGSGGGGSMRAGYFFANMIDNCKNKVRLISGPVSKEVSERLACIVCDMGSISQFDNNQHEALMLSFNTLNQHFRDQLGPVAALFPIETGPENTLAALFVGAHADIPVIDGDGAGRAIPTLPLSTFAAIGGIQHWRPVSIANGNGDFMLVNSHVSGELELILRSITNTGVFGDSSSLALWPDKVGNHYKRCVPGTISRALSLGRLLDGISQNDLPLISASLKTVNSLKAYIIGAGTVEHVDAVEKNAFAFSVIKVTNSINNDTLTILGQNENLIVYSDNSSAPVAIAPDSICYLTHDLKPLTNVEIEKGQSVFLICVKAADKLQSPQIIDRLRKALLDLGYGGDIFPGKRKFQNLGDLIMQL